MRLLKSIGISFATYVGINLIILLILSFSTFKYFSLLPFRIMPPGYDIISNFRGISSTGEIIWNIIIAFLPGIVTSIIAGRISETKKQAFSSLMLTMVLSGIVLIVLYFASNNIAINANNIYGSAFLNYNSTFATVSRKISVVIWIFVLSIFTGFFYSVFSIIFVKRNLQKEL